MHWRLYRQRNLVVHGGQVHGIALAAALRTAAPLVGAGLDRVTHAFLTQNTPPLQLAAQAQMEVARTGSPGAPSLTAMLEWGKTEIGDSTEAVAGLG